MRLSSSGLVVVAVTLAAQPAAAPVDPAQGAPVLVTPPAIGEIATNRAAQLKAAGYVEQEFFVEGTARAYAKRGEWPSDGVWAVAPGDAAPYTIRMEAAQFQFPTRTSPSVVRGQAVNAGQARPPSGRTGRLLVTRLNVRDLSASLRFFAEGLGLSEQSRFVPSKGSVEVTVGDPGNPLPSSIMLLHRESRTTAYDPGEWGTLVLEVKDARAAAANAAAAGGKLVRPPADSPAAPVIVAVVQDPDGHQFELVQFK